VAVDINQVRKVVKEHYDRARSNVFIIKKAILEHAEAISDVVPGYQAKQLEFGSYLKDNFTVLFIDMRNSTIRAKTIGPEKTFLSLHAFIPAMIYIIEYYQGHVIDIMGDGIMAFFGGKSSNMAHSIAMQKAGLCAVDMLKAIDEVVNPIILEDKIEWKISCGVGIDHGDVIVTKVGTDGVHDVKAFGDCINTASKLSSGRGTVVVTKKIKDEWPESKGGKIVFRPVSVKGIDGYSLGKNSS
jgi:class 3 adenylate cyclase